MKIIAAPDLHIREKRPENRIDENYFQTQYEKIEWIVNFTNKVEGILCLPGDVFDSPTQSYFALAKYLELFRSIPFVYAIRGQHDLRYHDLNNDNIPLTLLEAAMSLNLLSKKPIQYEQSRWLFYGCSYGEPIPKIENKDAFNILLIHKMIIDSDKIWEGQEEYVYAQNLIRTSGFDLIISGDNHQFFTSSWKGKHLFNCGSLMRSTTAQLDHKPCIVVFETKNYSFQILPIPIKPINQVFDLKQLEEKKEKEEQFEAFVKGLSESKDISLNFMDQLLAYIKENNISEDTIKIIMEAANGSNH